MLHRNVRRDIGPQPLLQHKLMLLSVLRMSSPIQHRQSLADA